MKIRILSTLLVGALAASCGDTSTDPAAQQNLDRPIDISFACWGGLRLTNGGTATVDQDVVRSAQPLESCRTWSDRVKRDPTNENSELIPKAPPGQEALEDGITVPITEWVGFILQSAPGTVAVATFSTIPSLEFSAGGGGLKIQDIDPLTPGVNGISVGEDPIAIVPDKTGCYQMVANAGSCDLTELDVGSALDTDPAVNVNRRKITNASGAEMLARPFAMVVEPQETVIGNACPAQATGIVYIAYPACHLVAAVDSSTGTIVGGIDFASGTPTITDGNVSCPAECGGGGTFTAGVRPIALDLERDERNLGTRLVIGADNSNQLTIVNLGADSLPASLQPILLDDPAGDLGVTAVTLGPQIGMGGFSGSLNDDLAVGGDFQFVYAVTTDDSIRVADILNVNAECDTNVDPRVIDNVTNVRELSCFPVTTPPNPARRANARGPGIRLPATYHDVVPTSIDIFQASGPQPDTKPTSLVGYFVMASASNGATFVIDVDDDNRPDYKEQGAPMVVQLPLAIAHHIRDAVPERDRTNLVEIKDTGGNVLSRDRYCDDLGPDPDDTAGNKGGTRSTASPTRNVPSGFVAAEKVGELPYIRQVLCTGEGENGGSTTRPVSELGFSAPDDVRDMTYQDLMKLRDETWTLTYEGSLSLDSSDVDIDGPSVRVSQVLVDQLGMHLVDAAKPYCEAGVEQWDIVQMRGCDPSVGDAQCPLGYTCFVHPNSQLAGLGACMLDDEAGRLADACKDFLTTSRRYTVGRSTSGELKLLPRRRQLATSPVDGCVDDNQCTNLADYAKQLAGSAHPANDTTEPSARTYACLADPDRAPLDGAGQTGKRCLETCSESSDCSTGAVCREGVCMEGVIPPQSCVNAPQRYDLHAHEAFTVVGSRSGYIHSTIRDQATDRCVRDPDAHAFDVGRVPLNPPACDPTADLRTGRLPSGAFDANPCLTTVEQVETVTNYVPGTCTVNDPTTVIATRQAPAIRYHQRGFMINVIDPTYPGDAECIKDGAGGLVGVPIVFPGYQLAWRQVAGLNPLILSGMKPAYPVKVVRGPLQSIWVVDEGDFFSTSLTESSTRGKVYRAEINYLTKAPLKIE